MYRFKTTVACVWLLLFVLALHWRASWPSHDTFGSTTSPARYAIATFLTGDLAEDSDEGGYFASARVLTYQLIHANETRIRDRNRQRIDWVIMVTEDVPESNRQQLRQDGAIVVPALDVSLPSWIKIPIHRWKDQFTKLRLFQMTQYTRLLFIDADSLLTRPIDGLFDELAVREPKRTIQDRPRDEDATYVDEYVFAARPDNGFRQGHDHVVPPDPGARSDYFNAGFWVAKPSEEMFSLFMHVMALNESFPSVMMEQSMLNHVFRHDGPMPWEELNWRWNANYPNARDLAAGVHCLHQKFWQGGDEHLRSLWQRWRARMENHFAGIEQVSDD